MTGRIARIVVVIILIPFALSSALLTAASVSGAVTAYHLYRGKNGDLGSLGSAAASGGRAAWLVGSAVGLWSPVLALPGPWRSAADSLTEDAATLRTLGRAAMTAAPALPAATGGDGPKRYLITALNDAELFGSGGSPLYATMIEFADGKVTAPVSGTVGESLSPESPPLAWDVVGGPPWYQPGATYPFVNSDFHPEFPLSGINIARAWQAIGYPPVDGVITLDINAVADILRETGPLDSPGYGELTADNIVRKVLVDVYRQYPKEGLGEQGLINNAKRRELNDNLRKALAGLLSDPANLPGIMRGIAAAIPGRHVQAYMADPQLQAGVIQVGADGAMATPPGDIIGVFMQAGVSKLSVFQQRSIDQDVVVAADGSATVRRTVTATNAVPADLPGDRTTTFGYLALIFEQFVAYRIPATATEAAVQTSGPTPRVPPESVGPYPDDAGGLVLWQGQQLTPQESAATTVTYRLPAGTFTAGDGLEYRVAANPQAFSSPVPMQVTVRFEGASPAGTAAGGWLPEGGAYVWRGNLDRSLELQVSSP